MLKELIKLFHYLTTGIITAVFVVGLMYLGLNPIDLGKQVGAEIGQAFEFGIGSSASVGQNNYNKIAYQLEQKEKKLNEKEDRLQEIENNLGQQNMVTRQWLYYLIPAVVALFILMMMNYYFDYKEKQIITRIEREEKELAEKINKKK